jgi:deoxycytidylate deaminase
MVFSSLEKGIFRKIKETALALLPCERGEMRCFHVAAIYKKKRLVSIGWNKNQTHPKNIEYKYKKNAGCHAEMIACLRGRRENYTGYSIYVLRIDRNDKFNTSKPCDSCFNLLDSLNFKEIFATNSEGIFERII